MIEKFITMGLHDSETNFYRAGVSNTSFHKYETVGNFGFRTTDQQTQLYGNTAVFNTNGKK